MSGGSCRRPLLQRCLTLAMIALAAAMVASLAGRGTPAVQAQGEGQARRYVGFLRAVYPHPSTGETVYGHAVVWGEAEVGDQQSMMLLDGTLVAYGSHGDMEFWMGLDPNTMDVRWWRGVRQTSYTSAQVNDGNGSISGRRYYRIEWSGGWRVCYPGRSPFGRSWLAEDSAGNRLYVDTNCFVLADPQGNVLWARRADDTLWTRTALWVGNGFLVGGTYAPATYCGGSGARCYPFVGLLKPDGSGFEWLRYYAREDPTRLTYYYGRVSGIYPFGDGYLVFTGGDLVAIDNRGVVTWWRSGVCSNTVSPLGGNRFMSRCETVFAVVNALGCAPSSLGQCVEKEVRIREEVGIHGAGPVVAEGQSFAFVGYSFDRFLCHDLRQQAGEPCLMGNILVKFGPDLSLPEGMADPLPVTTTLEPEPYPDEPDEGKFLKDLLPATAQPVQDPDPPVYDLLAWAPLPWNRPALVVVPRPWLSWGRPDSDSLAVYRQLMASYAVTTDPAGLSCSRPQGICAAAFDNGAQVSVTLQRLDPGLWPPTGLTCSVRSFDSTSWYDITTSEIIALTGDALCTPFLDMSRVSFQLQGSPRTLKLADLQGTPRPRVTLTAALTVDGQPVQGVPVTATASVWDGSRMRPIGSLDMPSPSTTGANGQYIFYWDPPSAQELEQLGLLQRLPIGVTVEAVASPSVSDLEFIGITSSVEVRGLVVQRHAGADRNDTDGDGKKPVPLAEVSLDPTFPVDGTVLTGDDGRFSLPDVPCGTNATVYVRQMAPGEEYNVYTQSKWQGYVACPSSGDYVDIGEIYLAHLGITRPMLETRLPDLERKLGQTSSGVTAHQLFINNLRRRIPPSSNFGPTQPWEEEALRRLALAELVAKQGLDASFLIGECGVRYLWDSSFAILTGLFNKMVDAYAKALVEKGSKLWDLRFRGPIMDPAEREAIEKEVARLNGVEKAIVDTVARWHEQLLNLQIDTRSRLNPEILDRMAGGFDLTDFATDRGFNKWRALELAVRALNDYDILKAFYDWAKGVDQALATLTDWPGVVNTINSLRDQLISPINQLLENIRQAIENAAKQDMRQKMDQWLLDTAAWARTGDFLQSANSYREAAERVAGYIHQLDQLWGSLSAWCTNLENAYNIVFETAGAVQVASALLSLVTGGSTAALAAAMEGVQWGVLATKALTGVLFMTVADSQGPAGQLARRGMYEAFDKGGIIDAEEEEAREDIQVVIFSPAHVMAIDRMGRRAGIDAQGTIYNDVPGALVLPAGDAPLPDGDGETVGAHEQLVLPAEFAPYTIMVYGIGTGDYTLQVTVMTPWDAGPIASRTVTGNASPGSVHAVSLAWEWDLQVGDPVDISGQAAPALVLLAPDGSELQSTTRSLQGGELLVVRPYLRYGDGLLVPPSQVQWQTSDENVASLEPQEDGSLLLTAGRVGTATVTAQAGALQASFQVQVSPGAPWQVAVEARQEVLLPGGQACLRAQVLDGAGNPVPGAQVAFQAFGGEQPVAQGVTGQDGWTQPACATVPPTAGGPEAVTALVRDGDGSVLALGSGTIMVAPAIEGAEAWPERTGGRVTIWHDGAVVGYVDVPAGAFADVAAPLVSGAVLGEDAELPAPPPGSQLLRAVAVSVVDLARGVPVRPGQPLVLTLLGQGSGLRLAMLEGDSWRLLDSSPIDGGAAGSIGGPGVYAVLSQAGEGGSGGGGPAMHTLTVQVSGSGSGTVTSEPAGIACPRDCTEEFADGTAVQLTATPQQGSVFAGWSGDCSGAGATVTVTLNADKSCTATFNAASGGGGGGGLPPAPPAPPPTTTVTVPSPTGTGDLTFQVIGSVTPFSLQVEPYAGAPPVPLPEGYSLPHGLYAITAAGLPPGASITVQVTLPGPLPVGAVWLKLVGGSWLPIPIGDDDGDSVITLTLTDGGQGDADGAANGVIADPGGPAIPQQEQQPAPPPPSAPPAAPGLVSLWPCGPGLACISFQPPEGATSYRLESALDAGFSFGVNSVEVEGSSLLWGNTIVVGMPGQDLLSYYYRLSACNGAGCSPVVFVGGMAARRFPAGTGEHWAFVVGGYRFLGVSYGWVQSQVSVPGKASELHLYDGVQGYGGTRVHSCSAVQPGGSCSWQWASGDVWLSGSQEFPPYAEIGVAVRLSP